MKGRIITLLVVVFMMSFTKAVLAATPEEDVATMIKLRNYECGGNAVKSMNESFDNTGNRIITAICPNGDQYHIVINTESGIVIVKKL